MPFEILLRGDHLIRSRCGPQGQATVILMLPPVDRKTGTGVRQYNIEHDPRA